MFMLDSLLMITLTCFDCSVHEKAYQEMLDYRTIERGTVSEEQASSWNLDVAGREFFIMQPASGAPVYLRFIANEEGKKEDHEPLRHLGWNAIEILVEDTDTLASELEQSSYFQVVQPPAYLTDQKNIRALQATGPANEMLYLTEIHDPGKTFFNLGTAQSRVDRPFIMVLGTSDIEASRRFYQNVLKMHTTEPMAYRIAVLSEAYGVPEDSLHRIALAGLPEKLAIEMDEYPAGALPLTEKKSLGGILSISYAVSDLNALAQLPEAGETSSHEHAPFGRYRALTLRGPTGELIEFIELSKPEN